MSDAAPGTVDTPNGAARPEVAEEEQVSSLRLIFTLGSAGAMAGLLVVLVFGITQPTIQAYKQKMLRLAVSEVLQGPERYETLYVTQGALMAAQAGEQEEAAPPAGADPDQKVYLGHDASDRPVGFAVVAAQPGFQDMVRLIFGFDAANGELLGMKVLESKETPGLGDKIEKDAAFLAQFQGVRPPLVGVKAGSASHPEAGEVDMITGATISSRAVIRIINQSLEELRPVLEAHLQMDPP